MDNIMIYSLLKNKKVLSTVKVVDKLLILIKNKYMDDIIIKINDNVIKLKYYNNFNILSLLNKYHVNDYKFIDYTYIGCDVYELIIDINNLNVIFDLYIDFVNHFI